MRHFLVTDQWNATAGKIQIFTTAVKTLNETENSTRISGYNHIVFKNITFAKKRNPSIWNFSFWWLCNKRTFAFSFDKTVEMQ
jgi:hypothetical protein